MPTTAKKPLRRPKTAQASARGGRSAAGLRAGGRVIKATATKGGGVRQPVKPKGRGTKAGGRPTDAARLTAAEKAADVAARRRIAATLDVGAFMASLRDTAAVTAKHWETPD